MFTYAELLTLWDGLDKLPHNAEITHQGEKVSVQALKVKVLEAAQSLNAG